jgi:hypothetical protein
VTITFDAPANATAVNASSFYVQNTTGATAPATDATFDEANGTVEMTFDVVQVRPLVRPGGDLDAYGSYTDSRYEDEWVYWPSAVLNGDVDATDLSDLGAIDDASVLSASSTTVATDETTTVNLTLSTTEGFSGGDVTVSVENGSVAEVTRANYSDELGLTKSPRVTENGTAVHLTVADVDRAIEPGATEAHLATISVRGVSRGTTAVTVTPGRFDNEAGTSSTLVVRDGDVTVGSDATSGETVRDVNGNGRVDYDDAVALLAALDDGPTDNVDEYDFNGNGRLDYDDVVDLYQSVQASA